MHGHGRDRPGEPGPRLSERLAGVVDALPLRPGMRVLEIGGAPGAAARAVARRLGDGHIVVVDRSARGVALIERHAAAEMAAGLLSVRHVAVEDLHLLPGEPPFDLAFAIRVGALDGRHPEVEVRARQRVAAALGPGAKLFIDGGDPLRVVDLHGSTERDVPATRQGVVDRAVARSTPGSRRDR